MGFGIAYILFKLIIKVVNLRGLDKYGSKHTVSRTNVKAKIGGTYGKMGTYGVGTDEKEQTNYTYEKANNENAKIRELYVRMTKHIFGTTLSHNFLKICHTRVRKNKLLEVN